MSRLVELSTEECLGILQTRTVGRIGFVTPRGLMIFPVNYSMSSDAIVFRTLPYGVIANSAHEAEVAFEVDSLDDEMKEGWSVLASGWSRRLEEPDEVRVIREDLDPEPWVDGLRNLYFRIEWTNLTGRLLSRNAT